MKKVLQLGAKTVQRSNMQTGREIANQVKKGAKDVLVAKRDELIDPYKDAMKAASIKAAEGFVVGVKSGFTVGSQDASADFNKVLDSKVSSHTDMAASIKNALMDNDKKASSKQASESHSVVSSLIGIGHLAVQNSPEHHKQKVSEVAGNVVATAHTFFNESQEMAGAAGRAAGSIVGESAATKVKQAKEMGESVVVSTTAKVKQIGSAVEEVATAKVAQVRDVTQFIKARFEATSISPIATPTIPNLKNANKEKGPAL